MDSSRSSVTLAESAMDSCHGISGDIANGLALHGVTQNKTLSAQKPVQEAAACAACMSPEVTEAFEKLALKGEGRPLLQARRVTQQEQSFSPFTRLEKVVTPKGELIYVGWDGDSDPENPRNWPSRRKWFLSILGFTFTAFVSITVSGYSITVGSITEELHTSRELALLGITTFTLTFGIAPLILAPLSEVWGRRWITIGSAFVFFIFHLPQALAPNISCMVIARFLAGIGGSTAISLVGGMLSDLFSNEDRGIPMAAFSFAAFAPTGCGPILGGYIAQERGFRLFFWIIFALTGVFTIFLLFLMKETRESVLLSAKAKRLRLKSGDKRFVAQADEERASLAVIMKVALTRPVRLFFTEPVLQAFTIWLSFAWAVLYLLLVSIPIIFTEVYAFSIGQVGLVYITQIVGSVAGTVICLWGDKMYHRHFDTHGPEARMWTGMSGGILFPLGCWIFTWTSWKFVHWIVPCIGVTILYAGLLLIYLTAFNYISDCWTMYAASALAAMNVWRNVVGAVFPLFGVQTYDALGIHGAGSLVAGIATLLALVPIVAYKYGGRLRAQSRYAKELLARENEAKNVKSEQNQTVGQV